MKYNISKTKLKRKLVKAVIKELMSNIDVEINTAPQVEKYLQTILSKLLNFKIKVMNVKHSEDGKTINGEVMFNISKKEAMVLEFAAVSLFDN